MNPDLNYYYGEPGGETHGPLPLRTIRNAIQAGKLSQRVMVSLGSHGPWVSLAGAIHRDISAGATAPEGAPKAADHPSYWAYTLASIIIPLIGLILGIVCLVRPEPVDRKLGEHCLAISVVMCVVYTLLFQVL